MSKIGKKIKKLRESQGYSQRKLARLAEVSNDYISKIEMGKITNVGVETLRKIARPLDINLLELQSESPVEYSNYLTSQRLRSPTPSYNAKSDKTTEELLKYWQLLDSKAKKEIVSEIKERVKK
jgi:transcriptional regulator with XRE-family HTH domain